MKPAPAIRPLVLLALVGFAPPSRRLEISPAYIPANGGVLRVRLPARVTPAREAISVGLSFGKLARLPAVVEDREGVRRFCVDVPRLSHLFTPPPEAGDRLLVVVYAGLRPLTAPIVLPVSSARVEDVSRRDSRGCGSPA